MHLIVAKLLSLTAIAMVSLGMGVLPYHLVYWFRSRGVIKTAGVRMFLTAAICFSGGTMLGVAFLHLMPDMRAKMAALGWEGYWDTLPVSDTITCGGFFFVYLVDELMHMFVEWYSSRARARESETTLAVAEAPTASSSVMHIRSRPDASKMEAKTASDVEVDPCVSTAPLHHEVHLHHDLHQQRSSQFLMATGLTSKFGKEMALQGQRSLGLLEVPLSTAIPPPLLGFHEHEHDPHASGHPLGSAIHVPPLTGLITVITISFHDIFEGLAIGIESDARDVLFMYLSIAAHKYAISFCIGMDLALSGTRPHLIILYMLTFSLVSPVGIVAGMIITAQQHDMASNVQVDTPVTVILQGLAGGTLIYVVCFEVLQREGSATHAKGVFNVIFVLIGFLLTLTFKIVLGHSHSSHLRPVGSTLSL